MYSSYHQTPKKPKKLLEQVRDLIRLKHYSYRTEKSGKNPTKIEMSTEPRLSKNIIKSTYVCSPLQLAFPSKARGRK